MIVIDCQHDFLQENSPIKRRSSFLGCEMMAEIPSLDETTSSEDSSEGQATATSRSIPTTLYDPVECRHYTMDDPTQREDHDEEDDSHAETMQASFSSAFSSGDALNLASESQVELLLIDLSRHVKVCMERKNELHQVIRKSFAKAKARYSSGGTASALVSMRRIAKLRLELARLGVCRCTLMEIFVQVKTELQQHDDKPTSDDDSDGDEDYEDEGSTASSRCHEHFQPQLVDLELEFFRSAMEQAVQAIHAPKRIERTDQELLKELA